jgi:hypothetical protein
MPSNNPPSPAEVEQRVAISSDDLLPDRVEKNADLDEIEEMRRRVLKKAGPLMIEEIKLELERHSFKSPPTRLKNSFSYEIIRDQIVILSDHPAAKYLNRGVDPYQMDHLTQSAQPIPIMTDEGDVIYREATPETMADGKWHHPGLDSTHFLDKAIDRARDKLKEKMMVEYREFLEKKARELFGDRADRIYNRIEDLT